MTQSVSPDLSDEEIDAICAGRVQSAAKVRYLRSFGLTVRQKPNGKPLVHRAHYDDLMQGVTSNGRRATSGIRWGQHEAA
jgi:hypothetical protein